MAETPNEEQLQNQAPVDDFDAAFDELAAEGGREGSPAESSDAPAEPEPEPNQEEPAEEPAQPKEEPDDWQHKYDSMMGRFKAAQNENKELRDRLTALEEAEKKRQESAQKAEEPKEELDLEGIADDYRPLFTEKSKDGERARKMLEDFGPEYAQNFAETVKVRREMEETQAQIKKQGEDERMQRHREALCKAAPEYTDAIMGKDQQSWNDLINGVNAWIDTLPYSEGKRMAQVVQSGTTEEVANMLGRYTKFRKGSKETARNLAKSNIAVPRTGGVPQSAHASADDYDAAWEEAAKE